LWPAPAAIQVLTKREQKRAVSQTMFKKIQAKPNRTDGSTYVEKMNKA